MPIHFVLILQLKLEELVIFWPARLCSLAVQQRNVIVTRMDIFHVFSLNLGAFC